MPQDLDARRKRILFRSLRRGTKESDLVIGGFAESVLPRLDAAQLDALEALLERPDPELLGWVIGLRPVPAEFDTDVMTMLKAYKGAL
ncbi:MAG: succinate dehydrogenase assembly factor 2 [Defluviicoccus sp.]|nr:succinate dehydrogenase assembly factor 2 [Defluviicoccus sp.]MDE0382956.1 succinate dehydrogenase assembly factor 2 [Defluviicoccus sp.]